MKDMESVNVTQIVQLFLYSFASYVLLQLSYEPNQQDKVGEIEELTRENHQAYLIKM